MSLLLTEGHADARHYPVVMAWSEARIARQRNASRMKMQAVLQQQVIAAALTKEGHKLFAKTIGGLDEHD